MSWRGARDCGGKMNPIVEVIYTNYPGSSAWDVFGRSAFGHEIEFGVHDVEPTLATLKRRFSVTFSKGLKLRGPHSRDDEWVSWIRHGAVNQTAFTYAEKSKYFAQRRAEWEADVPAQQTEGAAQ